MLIRVYKCCVSPSSRVDGYGRRFQPAGADCLLLSALPRSRKRRQQQRQPPPPTQPRSGVAPRPPPSAAPLPSLRPQPAPGAWSARPAPTAPCSFPAALVSLPPGSHWTDLPLNWWEPRIPKQKHDAHDSPPRDWSTSSVYEHFKELKYPLKV